MPSFSTRFTLAVAFLACLITQSDAFSTGFYSQVPRTILQAKSSSTSSSSDSAAVSRRNALFGIMGTVGAVMAANPEEASASYSAYTNREKDWEERKAKGDITYKSARDLKSELRAIVPANSESSKIFCPNGPSAAVSPLMENRCGDRMALPSVYGKQQDAVGNYIPGFSTANGFTKPSLEAGGGFPQYN